MREGSKGKECTGIFHQVNTGREGRKEEGREGIWIIREKRKGGEGWRKE